MCVFTVFTFPVILCCSCQLCEDGEVTIEELRGRSVSSGPIIEDCRSKTLEIKKRQNQVDSEWAKVESTLKNTVRLKEFREEAVVVLVDMKELIHHSLSNVKFGDDIEDFDQREEEFVNSEQKCRVSVHRVFPRLKESYCIWL